MLPLRTYVEILDRLEALRVYLIKLKVKRIPERLDGAITNLKELEQARQRGRAEELFALDERRVQELVWSVVEASLLATIFDIIGDYDPKVFKKKLLKALLGPLHPIDETGNSNEGRNTLFELFLAALFRRKGAEIEIGWDADLRIDYRKARLYIECKRPLRVENLPTNIARARHQVEYRIKTERRTSRRTSEFGGLVAISVSKTLNRGEKMFVVDDKEGLNSLGDDIAKIRRLYPDNHNSQPNPRLIGMLYHLFTPAYVRSTGLLTCAMETHVFVVTESVQESFPESGEALKEMLSSLGESG
jgi:hypothetical protein